MADALTDAILSGEFPPGATLPPERDLARRFGVNRTTLRQSLSRLEQLGLVEVVQGRGTVVRDPASNPDPVLLGRMLPLSGPDLVGEVMELREALLGWMAELAARRARRRDLTRLERLVREVAAAETADECQQRERDWFDALADTTRNRPLALVLRWVWRAYEEVAPVFREAFGDPAVVASDLGRVTEAVSRRSPEEAGDEMRRYARRSAARMEAVLRRSGPPAP